MKKYILIAMVLLPLLVMGQTTEVKKNETKKAKIEKVKETKKAKEPKAVKQPKEVKQPKAAKEPKAVKQTKEVKQPKAAKEPKAVKQPKEVKQPKAAKEPKAVKQPKEVKQPKAAKEPKAVKQPKEVKQPKAAKEPKAVKQPKAVKVEELKPEKIKPVKEQKAIKSESPATPTRTRPTSVKAVGHKVFASNNITKDGDRNWAFGIQIGTDIGGAIPVPLKFIPKTFNPYPKLGISIGGRISRNLKGRWSISHEFTYKTVAMNADARVENQRYEKPGTGTSQYFSGSAEMEMSFTMMEFPVYVKWAMSKKFNSFLLFGGYYALNLNQKFDINAYKGYVGGKPDEFDGHITEAEPMVMQFTQDLGKHDFGAMIGYERRIWDRANIGIRVMVGVKDIFNVKSLDYKMLQMRASFYLEYDLFRVR